MDLIPKTTEPKKFAKRDHHLLKPELQTRLSTRNKIVICSILFISWAFIFINLSSSANPPLLEPSTSENLPVRHFSCGEAFFPSPEACGNGGEKCVPNTSGVFEAKTMGFRCPANCVRDAPQDSTPHLVGNQDVTRRPLVIGGPIYRGDSEMCAAAVHAGVLEDAKGGCGVVKRMGQTNSFAGTDIYGVESLSVKTYFPLTFNFPMTNEEVLGACPEINDRSWALPWVSVGHTVLFFQITASAGARAVWIVSVASAHLLRLRSGSEPAEVVSVPAQKAVSDSAPIPNILEPEVYGQTLDNSVSNITFRWATPPPGVEGISMLVDDVERDRVYFRDGHAKDSFFWKRGPQAFVDYIRFGYVKDGAVLKYSPAGTWLLNDTWTGISANAAAS
ncbi:LCCL domain-containing protein [Diaporthe helianthi]|uniref:LCCL domain-containing protein n=1 Tax=Diaporthe helianthi TaxID=158607 RepID=A0A2P5HH74_DIAHE|nr:LCCL domain-containing protein [Diaporthe helianthi]